MRISATKRRLAKMISDARQARSAWLAVVNRVARLVGLSPEIVAAEIKGSDRETALELAERLLGGE